MLNSEYVPPYNSDLYACNTSNLADVYLFKILDLNIPTSDSHQCQNALKHFRKRDPNGEVFITDRHGAWFSITDIYDTTTHSNSYRQFAIHKLASIIFFHKNIDDATISIFSTSSSLPSVTMSQLVVRRKLWMNSPILRSLIP